GTYLVQARVSDAAGNNGTSAPVALEVGADPYARPPLNFEPNAGQTTSQVQFLTRARNYALYLTPTGVSLSLATSSSTGPDSGTAPGGATSGGPTTGSTPPGGTTSDGTTSG